MILLLICLQQDKPPTVGDTLWLSRTVPIPAGYAVRAAPWTPSGAIELLGKPSVTVEGTTATVFYPAVAWEPGTHRIQVPGPLLLGPNGESDSLPGQTVTVEVASVLPPDLPDSAIKIQPQAGLVPRRAQSWVPLALLWAAAVLLLVPFALWWRRGPRKPRTLDAPPPGPAAPPIDRWAEAGEQRAVAAAAAAAFREAIATRIPEAHAALDAEACLHVLARARPAWPMDDIARIMRLLESARFAPVAASEAEALHRKVSDLTRAISAERA